LYAAGWRWREYTGRGVMAPLSAGVEHATVDSVDSWGNISLPSTEGEHPLYIPSHGDQAPLAANLVAAQQKLSEAEKPTW
jgi:hypothetical protein